MVQERKKSLRGIMTLAWQMVRRNGFTMSEALRTAWANFKLVARMRRGIVKFYFRKVDGTMREAYGTLKEGLLPPMKGTGRKADDTLQTYYDTERCEYRCFKKANLAIA